MFGGYVYVDEIPNNESNEPAIHIYTRPFDLSSVKFRDSLSIYTTTDLKSVMINDDSNVHDNVQILEEGAIPLTIELPDEEKLEVQVFSCNSKTLNILVLFKYRERYTLHAGRFITNNSKLFKDRHKSKHLREVMEANKINDLYINTSSAHVTEANLKHGVLTHIKSLLKSKHFKGHKFHMLIDEFGYEDLLFMLAENGVKIHLNEKCAKIFGEQNLVQHFCKDQNDADIILVDKFSSDIQKQFVEKKIVTIVLSPDQLPIGEKCLEYIKYSAYPTMADIHYIANLANPIEIHPVGPATGFPFELNQLTRKKCKT